METTIYCGSGKKINDNFININLCLSDLPKEFITQASNGKKYIKLSLATRKETDQYGNTHSLKIDTWKPENKSPEPETDTLPF